MRRDLDELEDEENCVGFTVEQKVFIFFKRKKAIKKNLSKTSGDKLRIAQKAAELIQEQDVIFIDAGTTNELLINELSSKHMTVVTNSIHHATKLVEKNIPTVII